MKLEQVKEIANAVLYEGYLLYPYRRSAIKNRQRWTIGVVYPREYSAANGGIEPWTMRTECLLAGSADTSLDIRIRFLHLLTRSSAPSEIANADAQNLPGTENTGEWSLASRMANESWEEGIEREASASNVSLSSLLDHPRRVEFAFPHERIVDGPDGAAATEIVREQQQLAGVVIIAAEPVSEDIFKLSVQIENMTPGTGALSGNAVLLHSFVSTHTILRAEQGSFISLMDPPESLKAVAKECQNLHTWPVLAGEEGEYDTMLSSPIILYDYPQIAPESPGALFDGTEIDEILTLRIMTLTDEEKQEMRQGDERAREILERTEALSPEQFMKMHGVIRSLRPISEESEHTVAGQPSWQPLEGRSDPGGRPGNSVNTFPGEDYPPPASLLIGGKEVKAGNRVRLQPKARADAFDMLLAGKTARVEMIQQDFENRFYLVVTLDDDPGREQWDERVLPGPRFFFFPEEVELLEDSEDASWSRS